MEINLAVEEFESIKSGNTIDLVEHKGELIRLKYNPKEDFY